MRPENLSKPVSRLNAPAAEEMVKTVSGKMVPRARTKFILEEYHEENVDCFKINGRWYRLSSGLLSYNIDNKGFFLTKNVDNYDFNTKVIVGFDSKKNYIYGYTKLRPDFFIPVFQLSGEVIYALNPSIAAEIGRPNFTLGAYLFNDPTLEKNNMIKAHNLMFLNAQSFPYSLKDYGLDRVAVNKQLKNDELDYNNFHAVLAKAYHDENEKPTKSALSEQYNNVLGDVTFGIESESSQQMLVDLAMVSRAGLICLRDGSVGGYELVTLPHKGLQGLLSTIAQFSVANEVFAVDQTCSVHIHTGGFSLSHEQLLALYCLCFRLQDEIFEYVPPYKRNISYLSSLKHEYSEPLKNLGIVYKKGIIKEDGSVDKVKFGESFAVFCNFLTMGGANELIDIYKDQPKWKAENRYFWVNFVNFLAKPDATLEFRCFPPTFDQFTIAYWTILCKAIYKYGVTKWREILSDNFHVKLDNIWDFLLEGIEVENSKELIALVKTLRQIYAQVCGMQTAQVIMKHVTYQHHLKNVKDLKMIHSALGEPLKDDLEKLVWKKPDLLKEITDIVIN